MTFSPQLLALANYLAGEFDNREQAVAEPIWYVHLRLWHRPVPLFQEDSLTIFAEQANILKLDRPYRQRIIRLMQGSGSDASLKVQYYKPKNPSTLVGAGCNPGLLKTLTPDDLEFLPGCVLNITNQVLAPNSYQFTATPPPDTHCSFTVGSDVVQVSLGFEVSDGKFLSYDKGIDSTTGKATWGAILGPYCYTKREQY
ncbi:chorismate mutase [Nostocales cyanobacterium HT-58-2]|nr:chorismate mutase [Nostocales cyanobacterium HT-58-2]